MATDLREKADRAQDNALSLLRTAIGISPLIAAAYMGGTRVVANEAINIPVGRSDPVSTLERKIAGEARDLSVKQKLAKEKASASLVEKFQKELSSSEALKKVFQDVDQKKSLLHSLMIMIDDPSLGLSENARSTLKTKMFEMNNTGIDEAAAVEDISKVLKTVAQSPDVVEKWTSLRSQYADLGSQLRPAVQAIPSQGAAYNIIPTNLSRLQQGYMSKLQRGLGRDFHVEAVSYKEVTGGTGTVARIYENRGGTRYFKGTVPLSETLYRQGESGRTLRTMPKGVLDFEMLHKNPTGPLGRAYKTMPDFFIEDILKRRERGNLIWKEAMTYQTDFLANVSRNAGIGSYGQRHVLNQSLLGSRRFAFVNIDRVPESEQGKTIARLATQHSDTLDVGRSAKGLLYRTDSGLMGNINLAKGSLYATAQERFGWKVGKTNVIDRAFMPLTAREYQQSGRIDYFTGGFKRQGNLIYGSVVDALASTGQPIKQAAQALPSGVHATGAEGAMVFFDLGGKLSKSAVAGEGMAFTGRARTVMRQVQKTIINPTGQHMGSEALSRILAAGDAGATFTAEELRKGIYLGEGSSGKVMLPWNESTKSLRVRLNDATTQQVGRDTKSELSFAIEMAQEMSSVKGFSYGLKSNIETVDDVLRWEDADVADLIRGAAGRHGVDVPDIIRADSKMLKKGSMNMLNQLTSGASVVTRGAYGLDNMRVAAEMLDKSGQAILGIQSNLDRNTRTLAAYTQVILQELTARNVPAEDVALVVAGVYHGAEGKGTHGVPQHAIEDWVSNRMGSSYFASFKKTLGLRTAIGHEYIAKGESASEWGRARLGVDSRFAKTFQERLMLDAGMDMDTAAQLTSRILRNKIGFSQHYNTAHELLKMTQYAHGAQGAMSFATSKAERMGWKQLLAKGFVSEGSFAEYLKGSEHGVIADFSDAPDAVKAVLGNQERYFPGKAMFENIKGTVMKTEQGWKELDGPYAELLHSFQGRLMSNMNSPENLRSSMGEWNKQVSKMFANVAHTMYAGKIKGSIAPTAKGFDISSGFGLANEAQRIRAGEVALKSRSPSLFMEGTGFLTHISDARGTLNDKELAVRAQRFFTSMEAGSVKNSYIGLQAAFTREPQLATGNVQIGQVFRDLKEVTALGGRDTTFDLIRNSAAGRGLLEKHFGGQVPTSFADPRFRTRQAHGFFQDFVKNISSFSSGENSGGAWFPMLRDAQGNAVGSWTQAVGDTDGDHVGVIFFDQRSTAAYHRLTRGAKDQVAAREFRGRQMYNAFESQIKGAINNIKASMSPIDNADQQLVEDILKEVNLSMATGRIDSALRPAHQALWRYEADPLKKHVGRTFLGAIQEHLVIKSKNLQKYTSLPEQIERSFNRWTESGTNEAFQETRELLHSIFKGQDIAGPGVTLGKVQLDTTDPKLLALWEKTYGQYGREMTITLDDILNSAHESIKQSVLEGKNKNLTRKRLEAGIERDAVDALDSIVASGLFGDFVPPTEEAHAVASDTLSNVKRAASKIDSHLTGKLALGALASAAAYGMVSGSMSPEPIIMPGEMPAGRSVMSDISSGSLFNRRDPIISPDELVAPPNQYDMMAPINPGTTYATRPNSYQIRGEVSSASGLATFSSYFGQLTGGNGRGVISINDQRRPITRNYVDRLLGEY